MDKKNLLCLLSLLILVFFVEFLGGLFTAATVKTWYPTLFKPSWSPPSWVFAPAWTILYILMAISMYLVWRRKEHVLFPVAAWLFAVQLFLNCIWSALFFTFQSPLWGMVDLIALWFLVAIMILCFFRISWLAAVLQIPYFLWITYALSLSIMIWIYN